MKSIFILITLLITTGIFLYLSFGIFRKTPFKKKITKWVISFLIALIMGCGIGTILILQNSSDAKKWNDGKCTECGSNYKLTDVENARTGGMYYYYSCDNCGKTICLMIRQDINK